MKKRSSQLSERNMFSPMAMSSPNKAEQELSPMISTESVDFCETNVADMADMKQARQSMSLHCNLFWWFSGPFKPVSFCLETLKV